MVGSVGSLCTVDGRPPSTSRVVGCHLVEELGFQLLDRRNSPAGRCSVKHWASVCLAGNRGSGAACRVVGFSFPPLSGESGVLAF
jgi:hypothetical protein